MTVNVYASTDASSPVLTSAVGAFAALLKACLVVGYGAKAAAGWTNPFSGTNIEVFRMGGGNQRYLRVDDTATVSPFEIRLVGYESMSDVNTGVGAFPTAVQVPNGTSFFRAQVTSAVARPWLVVATDKWVFVHVSTSATNFADYRKQMMFGDIESLTIGDQYNTILVGPPAGNVVNGDTQASLLLSGTLANHYIARNYTQIGGSIQVAKHSDALSLTGVGQGVLAYPNAADGGLYLAPIYIREGVSGGSALRGKLPGLWSHLHTAAAIVDGDTWTGTVALAGKMFRHCGYGATPGTVGGFTVEISNTW